MGQKCRILNVAIFADVQAAFLILWASPGPARTFLPIRSLDWVCPALHPATKKPALGGLKGSSTLVLTWGRNTGSSTRCSGRWHIGKCHPVGQVSVVFKRQNSVLFYFKDVGISKCTPRGSSLIVQSRSHPTFDSVLSSWTTYSFLSVSMLAGSGQLSKLLPRCPGLW